jgi:hypothetical protein
MSIADGSAQVSPIAERGIAKMSSESRARHDCGADIRNVNYYRKRELRSGRQTLKNSRPDAVA